MRRVWSHRLQHAQVHGVEPSEPEQVPRVQEVDTQELRVTSRGPFLTDIDSRAIVKGSRDPLGQVAIWTRIGRHVVGNLTTVSTSVRDFTVLLLGLWFVERVLDADGTQNEVQVFTRWEQLAGYARVRHPGVTFRGIEKVRANLNDSPKVTLSADRRFQILGNQKIYGVWGLYTVPAAASALTSGAPPQLLPHAREFVETHYVAALSRAGFRNGDAVVKLLAAPQASLHTDGKDEKLLDALAQLLRPTKFSPAERAFYDEHLIRGGPEDGTQGRQAQLAALLEKDAQDASFAWSPATVSALSLRAKDRGTPGSLGWRLDRIRDCEVVMAPAYRLFLFLLSRENQTVDAVAKEVRTAWGERLSKIDSERFAALEPELRQAVGDDAGTVRWLEVARALEAGRYADTVEHLIAHNADMMKQRGSGSAWVEIGKGKLRVRFRDDLAALPDRAAVPGLWRFPYFLDSLRAVTAQLRVPT